MHKKHKYDIIVLVSLVVFSLSLFLAINHYMQIVPPCQVTQGCEAVLNSKYAIFLGIPLSVWGVLYSSLVIILALLCNHYQAFHKVMLAVLGLGAFAALVFLGLQFFVLGKVCQYCLVIDLLNISLFLLDFNIEHPLSKKSVL